MAAIYHGVKTAKPIVYFGQPIEPVPHPLPPLAGAQLMRFFGWCVLAILRSAVDILRGHWWHAFLLAETTHAAKARFAAPELLAAEYLFNNGGHIYRPLWTYEAARRGSRVLFYFYSTSEQFKVGPEYESDRDEWGAMSWPTYLVWDHYQAAMIQRALGATPSIEIVGPIWFQSSSLQLSDLPDRTVAVFDIQPWRRSLNFGITTMADLHDKTVAGQLLRDVKVALSAHGGVMAHKRKRRLIGPLFPPYKHLLEQLAHDPAVISVDPDVSPIRLIEKCAAVVSMPFTSTALIARELGKPSIYYDPSGFVAKDDRGAHGIPVISGRAELEQWVAETLNPLPAVSLK